MVSAMRLTPIADHQSGLDFEGGCDYIGLMIATLRESKAHLSALVERAAQGEEVVITVRGKPKARPCPIASHTPPSEEDAPRWILNDLRGERS